MNIKEITSKCSCTMSDRTTMHTAENKRAWWPTGFFVVCTKIKKTCNWKFCSMFLVIRKPGSNLQPRPLRKSTRRALVSDDVNLGNTFSKIIALYLHVICLQVCELTLTSPPNNKTFCTKNSLIATSHTKALLFKIDIASWQQKSLLELKIENRLSLSLSLLYLSRHKWLRDRLR